MFEESRGSTGSAVLPLYLKSKNGGLFENQLGQDLVNAYNSTRPNQAAITSAVNEQAPTEAAAQTTGAGVFNGEMGNRLLGNAAPVQQARVTFARQNAMDALKKTLADIQTTQAGRGFTGDSMTNEQLGFEANKSAADAAASAALANLSENRDIKNQVYQYQLANLGLPSQLASQGADFTTMANQRFLDAVQQGLVPLNFVRLGTATPFQYQGFHRDVTPSAAQLALSSISQTGNTVLDAWLKNRQANAPGYTPVQSDPYVLSAANGAAIGANAPAESTWGGGATTPTWAGGDFGAGASAGAVDASAAAGAPGIAA